MKKLIILLMVMLPLGVFAQELKIAYVNYESVISALPEMADYEKTLMELREQYSKELQGMQDEHTKKMEEYIKVQDELTENIKLRRMQDIQDIEERMQNFVGVAEQEMSQKQNELIRPIVEKVNAAIKRVAERNKYTYVLHPQSLLFISDDAIDATEQVKKELGV